MSDREFDQVFGRRPEPRTSFAERVGQGQAFGGRNDPVAAMALEAASEQAAPGIYKAFGFIPSGTVNQSCEVRSWVDGTDVADGVVFFYRLLMQIGFTGSDELRLTCSPPMKGLASGRCSRCSLRAGSQTARKRRLVTAPGARTGTRLILVVNRDRRCVSAASP